MLQTPHFLRACPVCGRPLLIRVQYTGQTVACQHCSGSFVASDPAPPNRAARESGNRLMKKAEQLLERATRRLQPEHSIATS